MKFGPSPSDLMHRRKAEPLSEIELALTALTRHDSGRVLAVLARRFGDLDLADEAVQEALVEAATAWQRTGIPSNPAGWLLTVARRKALDILRRRSTSQRRMRASASELVAMRTDETPLDGGLLVDDGELADAGDDQLRLIFLCCHPALDQDSQIALTLRLIGGLTTPEIAAAFLVPEPTLAQRIVRAKRKIRDARIPLAMPKDISARLGVVTTVLYLVFNEGYLSRNDSGDVVRIDLASEATRLTKVLAGLTPYQPEVLGLLSLQLFHLARFSARTDPAGEIVLLDQQDRSLWDRALIDEGNAVLKAAMQIRHPGPLQVQALIASLHANARDSENTNWPAIVNAYDHLTRMSPSPVVQLNRAVAVAMAQGPQAGLAALDLLADNLRAYHLFHAARAELLLRNGDTEGARTSFELAKTLTLNPAELRHLDRRLATVPTTYGLQKRPNYLGVKP